MQVMPPSLSQFESKWSGTQSDPWQRHFFTFFGSQSFFLLFETKPHSLHRQSPGLALRIGLPFWQLMVVV
jgi:hypothetical protein